MKFRILKASKKSNARVGIVETPHGVFETPVFVTVATQAAVKTLDAHEAFEAKSRVLIVNTFHMHLKPGERIVKSAGGLHKFMKWNGPLMTDSGGFQVFSLGFGKDHGVGKILKEKTDATIIFGQQPKFIRINDDGVEFTSPLDGKKLFLGPKESIKIQQDLGADMIFAFDECTSPVANRAYTKESLFRTHRWADASLRAKTSNQAIFGVVQGGKFKDLRVQSARFIESRPFDGFGIGGEFGDKKRTMTEMLRWVIRELPEKKPRHLLGIGHLEDIPNIIREGVDMFDCIVPTHYARRAIAFTSQGKLNMNQSKFLKDKKPLDPKCGCRVCQTHSRMYITHLFRAKEILPMSLLTFHNLYFFNSYVERIREAIKGGRF